MVTISLRRVPTHTQGSENLYQQLKDRGYHLLPNTAGCFTAKEAILTGEYEVLRTLRTSDGELKAWKAREQEHGQLVRKCKASSTNLQSQFPPSPSWTIRHPSHLIELHGGLPAQPVPVRNPATHPLPNASPEPLLLPHKSVPRGPEVQTRLCQPQSTLVHPQDSTFSHTPAPSASSTPSLSLLRLPGFSQTASRAFG